MDALEKMHSDASGVQGPGADPAGRPWLNTPAAVGSVVQWYIKELLGMYGEVSESEFLARLEQNARMCNSLFIGADKPSLKYSRGPWNTPDQLGRFLMARMSFDCEDETLAVRDAFIHFAGHLVGILDSVSDQGAQQLGERLQGAGELMRGALLGLPGPTPLWFPRS